MLGRFGGYGGFTAFEGDGGAFGGGAFGGGGEGNDGHRDSMGGGGGGFLPMVGGTQEFGDGRSGGGGEGLATVPLQVASILKAHAACPSDNRLSILGTELFHFKLVGYIREVSRSDAEMLSFTLDDGTGTIQVEWFLNCLFERMSPYRQSKFDELRGEAWVAAYGEVNLLGKHEPHVKATMVRRLDDGNEIFAHVIDAAYFIVSKTHPQALQDDLTRQPPLQSQQGYAPAGRGGQDSTWQSSTVWQQQQQSMQGRTTGGGATYDALQQIETILKQLSPQQQPQGVHVAELVSRMKISGFPGCNEDQVRNALDKLSSEGTACFVRDADHWLAFE